MLTGFKNLAKKASSLFTPRKTHEYPIVIPRDKHTLSRSNLSTNAVKVLYRLNKEGFDAYLVGGCIRDHLIDMKPKDFDVVTSATPEEVHAIFSNSRLIGRRFRLVHVTFGREIIEVSTFRANAAPANKEDDKKSNNSSLKGKDSARSSHGIILRDNVWGDIEQDAQRRDFTFNALYYNVTDFSIHDYCGGLEDIQAQQVRIIGDASQRYQEDPVRMLRAVRFAAKLDFTIEAKTAAPIKEMAHLLDHIPPARLFEEVLKLLGSGNGVETYHLLKEYGLFRYLFPEIDDLIRTNWQSPLIEVEAFILKGLINTDKRLSEGKSTAPYFLYAVLLWPKVLHRHEEFLAQGLPETPALHQAASLVLDNQVAHTSIPRRFSTPMREIWDLQFRLPKRFGKRAFTLEQHPRFRAAFDFILIREESGSELGGLGEWWQLFQDANDKERRNLINKADPLKNGKKTSAKRRIRRRKSNTKSSFDTTSSTQNE
ncbi:polynucleotide adenylyltransferase PcnB [Marinomonas sp. 2405UD68-3]|uniref:polynucleotide adenylyltransferase PcnB n=1 Tax=Marinomonas sp. 2405UD68-3 TaxID=3391835 RepID=UPI0039C94561